MRLDAHLVAAGLARSRGHARELIEAGRVTVDGRRARKPSESGPHTRVAVAPGTDWVGRAALKLDGAFQAFGPQGWRVTGLRCLDVGASTGGFTQVLLAHGASHVTALDVGHGQLAHTIATDPRVRDLNGTNIRDVRPADLGVAFERVVADLSFISLKLVLPAIRAQLTDDGEAVLLIKPQFEVGRERLGKNGVVRSTPLRHDAVLSTVEAALGAGLHVKDVARSPVTGGTGNQEYLGWFTTTRTRVDLVALGQRLRHLDAGRPDPTHIQEDG